MPLKSKIPERPRVAVLLESSRPFGRGILLGLADYQKEHRRWSIYFQEGGLDELLPDWLRDWEGEGILVRIESQDVLARVKAKGVPVVDVRGVLRDPAIPLVKTNHAAVARQAAAHLMDLGLRQFAYCGYPGAEFSDARCAAFVDHLRRAGHGCDVFVPYDGRPASTIRQFEQYGLEHQAELAQWLDRLRKPSGLMACNDACGQQVISACRAASVNVPDEVAVIGVDNDAILCELSDPPLSSIPQNTRQISYQAAAILDTMMAGKRVSSKPILIPPLAVVRRHSTDVLAIADARLRRVVRHMRKHADQAQRVEEMAKMAGMSRRELERRFMQALGRSPKQEILRIRLQRVKELLAETDSPLYQVADQAGFQYPEYLNTLFKRKTGQTMRAYRRQMRRRI
jgi:LacI family transcriptional regulator